MDPNVPVGTNNSERPEDGPQDVVQTAEVAYDLDVDAPLALAEGDR